MRQAMRVFRAVSLPETLVVTARMLASGLAWACAYACALGFGLALRQAPPYGYAVVFPANGVLFSLLVVTPYRAWPGVFSLRIILDLLLRGAFGNWTLWSPVVVGASILEAAGGAYLARRLVFREGGLYADLRRVVWFLALVAALSGAFAATLGSLVAVEFFHTVDPVAETWNFWFSWWRSDALGIFLVAPVVVTWRRMARFPRPYVERPFESLCVVVSSFAVAWVVFGARPPFGDSSFYLPYPMLVVPVLIWALVRSDLRLVSLLILIIGLVSAWQTHQGRGPFSFLNAPIENQVLANQIYLTVLALSFLVFGAILAERQEAVEALARSEQQYRGVVEDQSEVIVRLLPDRTLSFVNDAGCRFANRAPEQLIGLRIPGELGGPSVARLSETLLRLRGEQSSTSLDLPSVRADGTNVWFQWTARALFDHRGDLTAYQCVGRDITQVKRFEDDLTEANERLQQLSTQLLNAQEEERRAVARELHDEIGQNLTALKISLQRLSRRAPNDASRLDLADTMRLADHALEEVRRLALELRPSILDDLGLTAALRWYLDGQSQRSGIAIRLEVAAWPQGREPSPAVATTCYRIVQEAVNNVVKHARAQRVEVVLYWRDDGLRLEVRDDGEGFDVDAARLRSRQGGSIGIFGMQERATLARGTFQLDSRPGHGTRVCVVFPINALEV